MFNFNGLHIAITTALLISAYLNHSITDDNLREMRWDKWSFRYQALYYTDA